MIPILYLHGLSTGDFKPALEQLLGEDAAGLSSTTIARMSKEWEQHHGRFSLRHLGFSRYGYLFIDGIHKLPQPHRPATYQLRSQRPWTGHLEPVERCAVTAGQLEVVLVELPPIGNLTEAPAGKLSTSLCDT